MSFFFVPANYPPVPPPLGGYAFGGGGHVPFMGPAAFGGGGGRGRGGWGRGGGRGRGGGASPLRGATVMEVPVPPPAMMWLPVDLKETPNTYVFMADLPGMRLVDIRLEFEDDQILWIYGERRRAAEAAVERFLNAERPVGTFARALRVPDNADLRRTTMKIENGVLIITVRKVGNDANEVRINEIHPDLEPLR